MEDIGLTSSMVSSRNLWPRRLCDGGCSPLAPRHFFIVIFTFFLLVAVISTQYHIYSLLPPTNLSTYYFSLPTSTDLSTHTCSRTRSTNLSMHTRSLPPSTNLSINCSDQRLLIVRSLNMFSLKIYRVESGNVHRGDLSKKGPYDGCASNKFPPTNLSRPFDHLPFPTHTIYFNSLLPFSSLSKKYTIYKGKPCKITLAYLSFNNIFFHQHTIYKG